MAQAPKKGQAKSAKLNAAAKKAAAAPNGPNDFNGAMKKVAKKGTAKKTTPAKKGATKKAAGGGKSGY